MPIDSMQAHFAQPSSNYEGGSLTFGRLPLKRMPLRALCTQDSTSYSCVLRTYSGTTSESLPMFLQYPALESRVPAIMFIGHATLEHHCNTDKGDIRQAPTQPQDIAEPEPPIQPHKI